MHDNLFPDLFSLIQLRFLAALYTWDSILPWNNIAGLTLGLSFLQLYPLKQIIDMFI